VHRLAGTCAARSSAEPLSQDDALFPRLCCDVLRQVLTAVGIWQVWQLTPLIRDDGGCSPLLKYSRHLSLAEVLRTVQTSAGGDVIFIVRDLGTQWG
jgi:hypothetical protein